MRGKAIFALLVTIFMMTPVQAGEVIAFSGEEGALSSGPHLHFEIWKNGLPIDPETILSFE